MHLPKQPSKDYTRNLIPVIRPGPLIHSLVNPSVDMLLPTGIFQHLHEINIDAVGLPWAFGQEQDGTCLPLLQGEHAFHPNASLVIHTDVLSDAQELKIKKRYHVTRSPLPGKIDENLSWP
ncbi:hypothetical protein TWF970_011612 [Orbilia oligospora]|uniref:Uncharacterized protein n=1 Tax=Orbilia oligospora TaxID=2813651 RepID=A0A7C8RPF9_ORBOL|nr:hypothetical protein TWF970_011612 [Orbilia oligospora]